MQGRTRTIEQYGRALPVAPAGVLVANKHACRTATKVHLLLLLHCPAPALSRWPVVLLALMARARRRHRWRRSCPLAWRLHGPRPWRRIPLRACVLPHALSQRHACCVPRKRCLARPWLRSAPPHGRRPRLLPPLWLRGPRRLPLLRPRRGGGGGAARRRRLRTSRIPRTSTRA